MWISSQFHYCGRSVVTTQNPVIRWHCHADRLPLFWPTRSSARFRCGIKSRPSSNGVSPTLHLFQPSTSPGISDTVMVKGEKVTAMYSHSLTIKSSVNHFPFPCLFDSIWHCSSKKHNKIPSKKTHRGWAFFLTLAATSCNLHETEIERELTISWVKKICQGYRKQRPVGDYTALIGIITPPPITIGFRGIVFDRFLCLFIYLFLCFIVSKVTRNFQGSCGVTMGRPDYTFSQRSHDATMRNTGVGFVVLSHHSLFLFVSMTIKGARFM